MRLHCVVVDSMEKTVTETLDDHGCVVVVCGFLGHGVVAVDAFVVHDAVAVLDDVVVLVDHPAVDGVVVVVDGAVVVVVVAAAAFSFVLP